MFPVSVPLVAFIYLGFCPSLTAGKLAWRDTKFLFTFGDSYTTDGEFVYNQCTTNAVRLTPVAGFNISAGVDSPVPGFVHSLAKVIANG